MKQTFVELAFGETRVIRIFRNRKDAMLAFGQSRMVVPMAREDAVGAIRYQLWLRSKGDCELCGSPVTETSGHMHERQHRGKGGEVSLDNSVFICFKCHRLAHVDRNPRWTKKNKGYPMNDSYHQDLANKTGSPVYVGPDNINGGSHWRYPQREIRPCPGLLAPEECGLDIGHLGSCVPKPPEEGGFVTENIKDGETVCAHGDRPFECVVCKIDRGK